MRLVEGRWPDAPGRDGASRDDFLALVDALAGRRVPVSVATHDPALARAALARLRAAQTECELEQVYGFPVRESLARALGVPVRVYVAARPARSPR